MDGLTKKNCFISPKEKAPGHYPAEHGGGKGGFIACNPRLQVGNRAG
jgi:hypothetical protein